MGRINVEKMFKKKYLEEYEKAFASILDNRRQHVGVYTSGMARALWDMAKNDVYPDGHFGDDECCVWSLFRKQRSKTDWDCEKKDLDKSFRDMYFEARKRAYEENKIDPVRQHDGVYTTTMLYALADMAVHDVFPDMHFSNDECMILKLFV